MVADSLMVADPMAMAPPPVSTASERDLRLDLFRGLALWLIFLDHIPDNIVSWITIRNYGFSDATEIFIFISGYTAAFVYGRTMRERGFVLASARILRRAWQIYVAHIFLFTIFMAEIAYVASTFENPLYAEEMKILDFLKQPDMTCSPAPTFMANSTLETYSQGDVPQASSSCIGCHGNAVSFQRHPSNPKPGTIHLNQSDFTFMLEKAQ